MILEHPPQRTALLVGKMPKAHNREIVSLKFVYNGVHVALCSIGHDCIKMWTLADMRMDNIVVFTEAAQFNKWRCGVQSSHILPDTSCTGVIGADSMIYSLETDDEGPHIRSYDMGYMESWHIACIQPGHFITTSFSGHISEVIDGKFGIREPYPKMKTVTTMAMSPSCKVIALGNQDGAVDIVDGKTLKVIHTFEAHYMRISTLLFLSDEYLLTGCYDKTIRMHKLVIGEPTTHTMERLFCSHRGTVSVMTASPSIDITRLFASASVNGQVILWNMDSSVALVHVDVPHEGSVNALAFSPCGQFLVTGGDDKLITIFRVGNEPIDEDVPLLTNGLEIEDEMKEVEEEEKENDIPNHIDEYSHDDNIDRTHHNEDDDDDEENTNNGGKVSTRDLFGDDSDSDEDEDRREEPMNESRDDDEEDDSNRRYEEGEGEGEGRRDEEEYEPSRYYGEEGEEGDRRDDEGDRDDSMDYGRDQSHVYNEEEGEGDGYGGSTQHVEGEGEAGGYGGAVEGEGGGYGGTVEGEGGGYGGTVEGEGGGYVPSRIVKKEEPMYQGYGDSPVKGEGRPHYDDYQNQ